ncbi:MAG: bifunctional UDP-N-acetylglucosamine diphosphorylase/glucosamine-1-phosphate N-acetyltransferase GlmU [Alphaproteobacteria bacterium]|nr:bifunctional UDP-N-acetylglucosamine diphosphorylase/glucosamine-1-phosphate N-acetyltransferase GlmU [Alphaproteobacteria bacterium]
MARAGIILAAGQGTRMKSATPKVMHLVAGLPILGHVIAAMRAAGVERIVVVTHREGDAVRAYAAKQGAESAIQEPQLGTGHAAACAAPSLAGFSGAVIVTYGDMPLMRPETFKASFAAQERTGMAMVGFRPADPASYGRMILDEKGLLDRIVEFKDADTAQRAVTLCNAGILAADARSFFGWACRLENNNAQKEYYLTDVPQLAKANGVRCAVVEADEVSMMGVNSRAELARAEAAMQARLRADALANAVGLTAPETVFLAYDTVLEPDCQIEPYVVFGPGVTIRSGAQIRAFSHLEGAEVGPGAIVGPYARLRPGAVLEGNVHVGNFVEVKNGRLEKGAKANHLTYLGDVRVGAGANIGAGTITCNYDGFGKYRTDIGAGAFIGSDTALVAPVKVGDGAITGAGSVITKDVPANALALTRAPQVEKPGWAEEFRTRKKAEKSAKKDK